VAEIRAIVLDFNGTLAQDNHLVAPLYVDMFATVGLALTVEEYHREFAAMPDRTVAEVALRRAGLPVDAASREALVRARLEGYMAAVAAEPPITEPALEFIRAAAAAGIALAITSGAFRREIEHVLAAAGVRQYFKALVSIDDVTNGKPDPEGYVRALAQLNEVTRSSPIAPGQTFAVEDATQGAQAAHAAGMWVAAIRGMGYDPTSQYANLVVDRLDRGALAQMLALGATEERS
jgi:beta-phosphoglucomutase